MTATTEYTHKFATLTSQEVLDALNVSRPTLANYVKAGIIRKARHGHYMKDSVIEFAKIPPQDRLMYLKRYRNMPASLPPQENYALLLYLDELKPKDHQEVYNALVSVLSDRKVHQLLLVEGNFPPLLQEALTTSEGVEVQVRLLEAGTYPDAPAILFQSEDRYQEWARKISVGDLHFHNTTHKAVLRLLEARQEDPKSTALFLDDLDPRLYRPDTDRGEIDRKAYEPRSARYGALPPLVDMGDLEAQNLLSPVQAQTLKMEYSSQEARVMEYWKACVDRHLENLRGLYGILSSADTDDRNEGISRLMGDALAFKTGYAVDPLRFSSLSYLLRLPEGKIFRTRKEQENILTIGAQLEGLIDLAFYL